MVGVISILSYSGTLLSTAALVGCSVSIWTEFYLDNNPVGYKFVLSENYLFKANNYS